MLLFFSLALISAAFNVYEITIGSSSAFFASDISDFFVFSIFTSTTGYIVG
jgi:hypothetical protein